ncbi:MAG: sulfotransferase [Marmoricola sp.]
MAEREGVRRLTRYVRERAPNRLVLWLRSLVELWGSVTSPFRLRPTFLIVGAQRAGTTTLYRVLTEHPQVARPTQSKGLGYFDVRYDSGPRWYRGQFPLSWRARRKHGPDVVTFETSGYYLYHPLAAERIARDLPDVRVVVLVREPVERAYSAHRHEQARGFETEPFEQALDLEEERLAGEVERIIADPSYVSFHHRHHSYLARSRYSEQIDRFIDLLGQDRVCILDAGAFFEDPAAEFERLRSWLGLSEWQPENVEQWNARPRSPMPADLQEKLSRYFEPYDARLAEQMGRTPSWRSS